MTLKMMAEKRSSPRRTTQQAVKVYDPRSGRYIGGIMRNASTTGALLELRGTLASQLGDWIGLAIEGDNGGAIVSHDRMASVVIRRFAEATAGSRCVAVEFAAVQPVALAA
ncbi:MAG: hypothetical protein WD294_04310 [Phycisphaeraceae bacterium]